MQKPSVGSQRSLVLGLAIWLVAACGGAAAPATTAPAPATATAAPATPAASTAGAATGTPAASGGTAACDPTTFKTVKPGILTVATYGTGIPDVVINPDKTMTGLEGALFTEFGKACGLKIELFETTFASTILAVKNREADVGTYIFWNPERSKQVYYAQAHWIADITNVFTRSDFDYKGPESLAGKKIGTVVGFVWAPFLQKSLGANASLFPDAVTGGTALMQGQIDGWINGSSTVNNPPFDTNPGVIKGHTFNAGDFGIPASIVTNKSHRIVSCDNKGLAIALDAGLKRMVDSGAYAKVMADNKVPISEAPELVSPEQGC